MDTTTSPNLSSNNAALLAVALSLGAVICGAAAGAANADTTPPTSETISISDLDLSTADGARAFLKRIDIAAQRACGEDPVRSRGRPLKPRMGLHLFLVPPLQFAHPLLRRRQGLGMVVRKRNHRLGDHTEVFLTGRKIRSSASVLHRDQHQRGKDHKNRQERDHVDQGKTHEPP